MVPLILFLLLAPTFAASASIDVSEELSYLRNLSRRMNEAVGRGGRNNKDIPTVALDATPVPDSVLYLADQDDKSELIPLDPLPVPESVSTLSLTTSVLTSVWSDPAFQIGFGFLVLMATLVAMVMCCRWDEKKTRQREPEPEEVAMALSPRRREMV
jgi:hypothetical protein